MLEKAMISKAESLVVPPLHSRGNQYEKDGCVHRMEGSYRKRGGLGKSCYTCLLQQELGVSS